MERFGFEMKKSYRETILQVLVSPAFLISSDHALRPGREGHLNQGHLMLSSLQVSFTMVQQHFLNLPLKPKESS